MYYRVAIQVDASPTWQWKSATLTSLNILMHWLLPVHAAQLAATSPGLGEAPGEGTER